MRSGAEVGFALRKSEKQQEPFYVESDSRVCKSLLFLPWDFVDCNFGGQILLGVQSLP